MTDRPRPADPPGSAPSSPRDPNVMDPPSRRNRWGRRLIAAGSILVGLYGLAFLFLKPELVPITVRASRHAVPIAFLIHVGGGGIALLAGPFQFSGTLRGRRPGLHRRAGYVYCTASFASALAGALLALRSTAGPVAGTGFFLLGCAWFTSTLIALSQAVRRRFESHRSWMTLSFGLALSAVTLRLYLVPVPLLGLDFVASYRVIAWAAWVPNLLVGLAISARRGHRFVAADRSPT